METSKLILLDIDGVMVPSKSWLVPQLMVDGFPEFDVRAVHGLNRIISHTGASIVLTTSHKWKRSMDEWAEIFRLRGIGASLERLPENREGLCRRNEIMRWVSGCGLVGGFVIIDDDKGLNDLPGWAKKHLVLTNPMIGLTEELAAQAVEILRKRFQTFCP